MSGRFSVGVNVCLDFDFKILCTLYIPRHKFPAWCHRWRLAAFNRVSDIWPVVRYTRCGHNTSSMKQFWCTCKIIGVKRIREIQSLYGRRWRLTLVTSVTRWRHDAMTLTLSRILTSATYNRPTLLRSLPFALRPKGASTAAVTPQYESRQQVAWVVKWPDYKANGHGSCRFWSSRDKATLSRCKLTTGTDMHSSIPWTSVVDTCDTWLAATV